MDPIKIWVVDDDAQLCKNLETLLTLGGFEIRTFIDPLEALKAVEADDFDVMICDLKMPQLDGLEVLARVKAARPDCEVLILTAFSTLASAIEAVTKGAFAYLRKPLRAAEALVVIQQAVNKRRLTLENQRLQKELGELREALRQKNEELNRARNQ